MSSSTRRTVRGPPFRRYRRSSPIINLDNDSNSEDSRTVDTAGNSVLQPRSIDYSDNNTGIQENGNENEEGNEEEESSSESESSLNTRLCKYISSKIHN